MTDHFAILSATKLYHLIFREIEQKFMLGIPGEIFFNPEKFSKGFCHIFNAELQTPIGLAAGPHSQLAPNIIAAWLCGARYIELKTVQTLDELTISKPCIDMQDEGYNCEWSQELKIHESYEEYLKAWIFIHMLHHYFKYPGSPGTVFNMSVGYDFNGIQKENVQWFFNKMQNCSTEKNNIIEELVDLYPALKSIHIPDCISNSVTLSTMHGCPPEEIQKIGNYLLEEKKLHTYIKLNPTLLGAEVLRQTLNVQNLFRTNVPDEAFAHDVKFDSAVEIIKFLRKVAKRENLFFGIKLTNTLESINNRSIFNEDEKMMYMSGRALHPLSIQVASKLQKTFDGTLPISFSGGVDFTNISQVLQCGIYPVTICTDLLKPGGYGRLAQYHQAIDKWLSAIESENFDYYFNQLNNDSILDILNDYSSLVLQNQYYKKDIFWEPEIKTGKTLTAFDCISAPCVSTCPTQQDIPDYLHHTAIGNIHSAQEIILRTNAMPSVCGMVCDHECENMCTRINYDQPLLIKEIKRFVTEQKVPENIKKAESVNVKVAIIGAGPSGLSCAYFLAINGFDVEIFEDRTAAGGMVSNAIPGFRIKMNVIETDVQRILDLGVKIHFQSHIDYKEFDNLKSRFSYIYIAIGAQKSKSAELFGSPILGLIDPLEFLAALKDGENILVGNKIAVIGGGNTAMDVARTAKKLVGNEGQVSILYRRSMIEMPADREEIKAAIAEGVEIKEYVLPIGLNGVDGILHEVVCCRTKVVTAISGQRPAVISIENSTFSLPCDAVIPSLGQEVVVDFMDEPLIQPDKQSCSSQFPNIYFGGDALRGASSIINAVADGKKAAYEITENAMQNISIIGLPQKTHSYEWHMIQRSVRKYSATEARHSSLQCDLVESDSVGLNVEEATQEATRCLQCDELCNICVTVCPNRANICYEIPWINISVPTIAQDAGLLVRHLAGEKRFTQKYQVFNLADLCNECGNCSTFCPTSGRPFFDKPRLFLDEKKFEKSVFGYLFKKVDNRCRLIGKSMTGISKLTDMDDHFIYENDAVVVRLKKSFFDLESFVFKDSGVTTQDMEEAAQMHLLYVSLCKFKLFQ